MNEPLIEMLVDSVELKSRAVQSLTFEEWERFMERSIQVLKDRLYYVTSHRANYFPEPPCAGG